MKKAAILLLIVFSEYTFSLDFFTSRGQLNLPVISYREQLFGEVHRQKYDFSCGSAALATLLTYHYQIVSDEQAIFKNMFERGNQDKIKQQGFSMLDMKNYLATLGLESDGFKLSMTKIKQVGVPGITLVNFDGYMHFVVIKGINETNIIIGDPSRGTITMKAEVFEKYYQGIVLLIRNSVDVGKASFISDNNFAMYQSAPLQQNVVRDSLGIFSTTLPEPGDN